MRLALSTLFSIALTVVAGGAFADEKKVCVDSYVAAQALRDDHRLLAAREQLRVCARQECATFMQGQIVKDCSSWLGQVEAAMPAIVFEAKDSAGNDLSAVRVKMDGAKLLDRLDGTAVAIDPGEHTFVFEANDFQEVQKKIVIREGEKGRRIAIRLVLKITAPDDRRTTDTGTVGEGSSRWPGYLALAVAAAGAAVGVTFTFITLNQKSTRDATATAAADCNANPYCTSDAGRRQQVQDNENTAYSLHNVDLGVAIAGYGLAVVGAGVGIYLLMRGGERSAATDGIRVVPWLGAGSAGLSGRF